MVVIVFFVLVEMMCIQNNREKICWWEKETEREYSTMRFVEDVIKMAADRQDGGRERKLV